MAPSKQLVCLALALCHSANALAPWNHGDPLKIFVAPQGPNGPCPGKSPTDPAGIYTQLSYDGTTIVAGALDKIDKDASTFFLTNGWRSLARDGTNFTSDKQTRIQLAYNGSSAAGCLSVNAEEGTLGVKACSFQDETQGFWVEQLVEDDGTSVSEITAATGIAKLTWPGSKGPSVLIQPSAGRVCFYNADNDWAISAGKTYIPSYALTQLWGQTVPGSDKPTDAVSLPGCTNADGSDNSNSLDCVLTISYNRAPAECATNPQATDCILNYLGAFCGDLVDGRKRANNPIPDAEVGNALEACARKIALGPCIANPTGAACMSGLFAGIRYPGLAGGSGSASSKRDELSARYAIFPEERAKGHIFEEFVIGVAKQLLNSISDTVKILFNPHAENSAIWCHGMAGALGSETLKSKCNRIWAMHEAPAPQLEYDNSIQKAGAITGLVVSNLLAINDAVNAAKAMNPEAWAGLRSLFKAPEAAEATVAGRVVKGFKVSGAGEGQGAGTVEISKLGPNGDTFPFASEEESQAALEEALENGFGDCIEVDPPKRKLRRSGSVSPRGLKRPMGLKLACPPLTSGDVSAAFRDQAAEASNPAANLGADAVQAKDLAGTAADDLTTLHKAYLGFTKDGTEAAATWGTELDPWAQRLRGGIASGAEKAAIAKDFAAQYGLTPEETEALRRWSRDYSISQDALKSALGKMPDYGGVCVRKTRMSQETVDMLVNSWGGRRGEPGVYDHQPGEHGREAAVHHGDFAGITKYQGDVGVISGARHTFIIRSSKGKYITPASQGQEEVAFIDGDQGRLKLLGWANGSDGKPAVFYFDNVA
ncbi:hypothetical protein ColTof4_03973 [Colletotrichum tofieldiae]|nr:hypothetical protein ColTof3_13818 [Colletotrichum tofieldiae]GKT71550.1 hypothetical protein ColTof4_03973 [Colletotrichum tofieldiae]